MSLNVEYQFNPSLKLTWEADTIKKVIESVAFLDGLPKACPVCDAPVHLFFRSPKGFNFYGLECEGSPKHQANFGQHKEGDSLFYEGDGKWELEYSAREGGNQGGSAAQPGSAASSAPSQPTSQPAQSAPPKGDKAPIEKLNMLGAVARAKKVGDLEAVCKEMLGKGTGELTSDEADTLLGYIKTL